MSEFSKRFWLIRAQMNAEVQIKSYNGILILRTAAKHNKANVGVNATVLQRGTIRRGDVAILE